MKKAKTADYVLLTAIFALVVFGLIMISSVSVYESYQITLNMVKKGLMEFPRNDYYLWRHFWKIIISIPIFLFFFSIPYTVWRKLALPFYIFSVFLLVLLFLPGFGASYGTSISWLDIRFLPSIQPAEIAKLGLIIYLASWMEKKKQVIETWQNGFIPFVVILGLSVFLLALQPDFGSIIVLTVISVSMFYAAGGSFLHIAAGGVISFFVAWPIVVSKDYIRNRFLAFLNPDNPAYAFNIGFQIKQALIAIGSGGIFGVGFGKSIQKFGYLPEVQSDTIFSAVSEELGFIRAVMLIAVFLFIAYRGFYIANHAPDRFGMLVATGVTSWIVFQAITNIAVNLSLFPLTGITLPFVSYGGSSLITNIAAAGVLLNISKYTISYAHYSRRRRIRRTHYSQPRYRRHY